ncbi:CobD/CbiB family cobalamin biosynthesis protein [Halorubrum sp. JWXQ-INN 858]|uniref:CobD/CbiB family cobalamin biosynthesis protein n=1 Tax=Halorubrum sp. JWXQ-INN 858 TaxID=2690782 RepID=UPI0013F7763E|nr:CobD/CbiB family cobalamin biosynthesis protein [Halorubrum sp. JWXQ-INN 858]MWV65116.1 CobD/CbiB family cobalamin biosynthesis protein [Halorubrum sp. JWXQ-INN 858]
MSLAAGGAVALAAALDRTVAEPPARVHPVAWLGRAVAAVDERAPDTRFVGVAVAAVLPLAFAGLAWGSVHAVASLDARLAAVVAAGVLFGCSSHRLLTDVASDVVALTDTDLEIARDRLRALAGRDAGGLSAGEVRSAAVESAAENLADGLIAPLSAFALVAVVAEATGVATTGTLALAAGAAAWVKGVNTLDSMLGYPHRRAGWGPARLDDAVMWIPARIAALLLAVVGRPTAVVTTLRRARTAAHEPSSPNSGWPMATAAAVLDVRLEKPGAYVLFDGRDLPTSAAARDGVRLVSRAGWLGVALTVAVVAL